MFRAEFRIKNEWKMNIKKNLKYFVLQKTREKVFKSQHDQQNTLEFEQLSIAKLIESAYTTNVLFNLP